MPRPQPQIPQQKVNMKKSLTRLARYLKNYSPIIIISLVLFALNTVFRIVGPNELAKMTNILEKAIPQFENGVMVSVGKAFELSQIWNIAKLLIILYVLGAVFTYIANILLEISLRSF